MDEIGMTLWGSALVALVIIATVYLILRIGQKTSRYSSLRYLFRWGSRPFLFLVLESGGMCIVPFLNISVEMEEWITHLLTAMIIITLGWGVVSLTKGMYTRQTEAFDKQPNKENQERTIRMQIIYRLIVVVVLFMTGAGICVTFPSVQNIGIAALGSAGIVGIAVGIAARPIILNYISGFYIGFSKFFKVGDEVAFHGQGGRIEAMTLTHAIIKSWDWKRYIVPLSFFVENTYENLSAVHEDMLAVAYVCCDFSAPIEALREEFERIVLSTPLWSQGEKGFLVTKTDATSMEIRLTASSFSSRDAFVLKCFLQERMIAFLQTHYPRSLPRFRYDNFIMN